MERIYLSTRGQTPPHTFSETVATGLAPDGGLFLPQTLPDISNVYSKWEGLSYQDLCFEWLKLFATDISEACLRNCIDRAYEHFSHIEVAPLIQLDDNLYVLELFHGPTLAFKDYPLQLLGNLYEEQIKRTGRPINVLGSTSGDTGSAAIHSLKDKEGVRMFILYPEGRIAPLQERQMACTGQPNVFPMAIEGHFDDAQRIVKELMRDPELSEKYHLSAVNSINLVRLLAQTVYYFYAALQIPSELRANIQFAVPSGNFGNVFAGWLAKRVGFPMDSVRVATNKNDLLYRFFKTGVYQPSAVHKTVAPSMDIQVASNFERFLYYAHDEDPEQVCAVMEAIRNEGSFSMPAPPNQDYCASYAVDAEIDNIVKHVYTKYMYVVDPHTACGFKDIDPAKVTIVLATAHPAKFPETITRATGQTPQSGVLEALRGLPINNTVLPADRSSIESFIRKHALSA